ncbi:MAG: alpha/beta hydrolase, partial [Nanoarchaeota archaeon]|nr:alpha/beta hydrolase [Nanoarchaeota archaeon]
KEIFMKILGEETVKKIEERGYYDLHKEPHAWRTKTEFRIAKKFLDEAKNIDIPSIFKKIKCPVLIVHGGTDEVVDVEFSKHLANREDNKFLEVIEGADHVFHAHEHEKRVIALSLNFLKKWLK